MNTKYVVALISILFVASSPCVGQNDPPQDVSTNTPALRDLDSYFPFKPPTTLAAWEQRKVELRKHLLVSLGLWPLPAKQDLTPVIHGKIEKSGYTIEKVYFESFPGFYVTGNLYKPDKIVGQLPGVLCPHGHWSNGRFHQESDQQIDAAVKNGAEQFRSNARSVLQARCANLARMGCIVFHYDMIGYADSTQISYELAHRFAKQRPEMNRPDAWGLFSPQAESNLQSVMGLQTWNSIRCLDFLCSLPDVDPNRLGVTGASGGGTQTFLLCAVDDRPAVAFPAVMVSTAMQGGCTCENCSLLRIGTGNVEMAAMFAPKPLGLTAANDWTKEMPTKGFPELEALYQLYGKPENVQLTARLEFGHNYNQVSRESMYGWFKQHFGLHAPAKETKIEFVEPSELTVFNSEHPRPDGGPDFETNLLQRLKVNSDRQIMELLTSAENEDPIGEIIGTFVEVVHDTAVAGQGVPEPVGQIQPADNGAMEELRFRDAGGSEHVLQSILSPNAKANVLLLDSSNRLLSSPKHPRRDLAQTLMKNQFTVSSFQNGWLRESDLKQSRKVANPREALAYTAGYNPPQLAIRSASWLPAVERLTGPPVFIVALDRAGRELALNSKYLSQNLDIRGLIVDTGGFRFQNIREIRDPDLLPGAAKYFDLPGLMSLAAPKPMLVFGEDESTAQILVERYRAAGAESRLQFSDRPETNDELSAFILKWIGENL